MAEFRDFLFTNGQIKYFKEKYIVYGNLKNEIVIKYINTIFSKFLKEPYVIKKIINKNCIEKIKKYGVEQIILNLSINKIKNHSLQKDGLLKKIKSLFEGEKDLSDDKLNTICEFKIFGKNEKHNAYLNDKSIEIMDSGESYRIVLKNKNGYIESSQFYYSKTVNYNKKEKFENKILEHFKEMEKFYNDNIEEIKTLIEY